MNSIQIEKVVEEYIEDKWKTEEKTHDISHIRRVIKMAMKINETEKGNPFIIKMIAYLHDVFDHKFYQGEDEEQKLEDLLKELKVYEQIGEKDRSNIIHSACNLGFASNYKENQVLSKEGKIVQDADRLDGIGAIGIARCFMYMGNRAKPLYEEGKTEIVSEEEYKRRGSRTAIGHFYDKLLKVKERLNTVAAKQLAEQRHQFMLNYLEEFYSEWNGLK